MMIVDGVCLTNEGFSLQNKDSVGTPQGLSAHHKNASYI